MCHDNEESYKNEEQLTCRFKIDMRNLTNFDPSPGKSKTFALKLAPLTKVYKFQAKKGTKELSLMTLKSDAKSEEKLTCGLKNNMRNFANLHWLK